MSNKVKVAVLEYLPEVPGALKIYDVVIVEAASGCSVRFKNKAIFSKLQSQLPGGENRDDALYPRLDFAEANAQDVIRNLSVHNDVEENYHVAGEIDYLLAE